MVYEVTVRKDGYRIARKVRVESGDETIADVIDRAFHRKRLDRMVRDFQRSHKNVSIKDWWTVIPQRSIPPIPEPLDFEALVDHHSI